MNIDDLAARQRLFKAVEGKPLAWPQIIAARTALRALPNLISGNDVWVLESVMDIFRALLISWSACRHPKVDFQNAAQLAGGSAASRANAIFERLTSANPEARTNVYDAKAGARSAAGAAESAAYAAHSISQVFAPDIAADAAAIAGAYAEDPVQIWGGVYFDCSWLAAQTVEVNAARDLVPIRLWLQNVPDGWHAKWASFCSMLLQFDSNYEIWIDWFTRRIVGAQTTFDIPGDSDSVEELSILLRIASATDEDFWGKGHEYVNSTLKGWLDEARERVAPPPIIGEARRALEISGSATGILGTISPDPQDARSPQFGLDPMGYIAIKADAGTDELRSDPQALSRHARALEMAQKLGEALRNHNNAGYLTEMASDYVAAMDGGPDGPDPSGLVFAGDQLREAIGKHRAAGTNDDLQPLPLSADRDASAFLAAHNMYVGSDPFLDDLDRTTRGPDAPLPSANPDEIRRVANTASQDDILAAQTYDYMIAVSEAAPDIYDPADRHSRFAAGLAQNFARYGIEFLWAYPNEATWAGLVGVGVGAIMAPGLLVAAGGTAAGIGIAYQLARNMIANEDTYRKWIATSPAGEDNFNRLMRFLKSLPIKSLKDD